MKKENFVTRLTGSKLTELEDIILSVFIKLAMKAVDFGEADTADSLVTVKVATVLRSCNAMTRAQDEAEAEAEDKYTLDNIKEALKKESNLFKPLLYENGKTFVIMNHIKFFEWKEDERIIFGIDRLIFIARTLV